MATIKIAAFALRKDGSLRSNRGRPVNKYIKATVIARRGTWVVTPFYRMHSQTFAKREFNVTHAPTGYGVFDFGGLPLGKAKRVLAAFAAMPDQARWRRLKNPRHMTKAMREQGLALKARFI